MNIHLIEMIKLQKVVKGSQREKGKGSQKGILAQLHLHPSTESKLKTHIFPLISSIHFSKKEKKRIKLLLETNRCLTRRFTFT